MNTMNPPFCLSDVTQAVAFSISLVMCFMRDVGEAESESEVADKVTDSPPVRSRTVSRSAASYERKERSDYKCEKSAELKTQKKGKEEGRSRETERKRTESRGWG